MMETDTVSNDVRSAGAERNTTTNVKPRHLLSDDSFNLLRQAQQRITDATDLAPSFRKMINALITQETIEELTDNLMRELRH